MLLNRAMQMGCGGGNAGWHLRWTINKTGTLQSNQEYYWEHKVNQGSWTYWGRSTTEYKDYYDSSIGSDGPGSSTTRYHQVRAYVVPEGESPPNNCDAGSNEPVESSEASRTADSCQE